MRFIIYNDDIYKGLRFITCMYDYIITFIL